MNIRDAEYLDEYLELLRERKLLLQKLKDTESQLDQAPSTDNQASKLSRAKVKLQFSKDFILSKIEPIRGTMYKGKR